MIEVDKPLKGIWSATGGSVIALGQSIASGEAGANIATTARLAVSNPSSIVEAGKEFGAQLTSGLEAAAQGDPEAIGGVLGTALMLSAPFAKGVAPSRSTTMFRAVGSAEAADINAAGAFRPSPTGSEYKHSSAMSAMRSS